MKYRKRPVVIEAFQYDGENCRSAAEFVGETHEDDDLCCDSHVYRIETLEGIMSANPGDWIIKGVKGEFYPCKPDIFEATYEAVGA